MTDTIRSIRESPLTADLVRSRVVIILLATLVISGTLVPNFLSAGTLTLSLDRMTTMGLLAVGLTVLLIAGQLDLSGGAILALSGITMISLQESIGHVPAILVGVLVGIACGILNGFLVVVLRINSLVATLASMLMIRAIAHVVTDSHPISGTDMTWGLFVTSRVVGPISFRSLLFLMSILLLTVWLSRTVSGRNLYAVGSSQEATAASGVNAKRYLFGSFVFAGLMAGVAGVVQSLAVNTGSPVFGETVVLTAIAAVVIGGTRLEGGQGSALGTLGGLMTMAFLTTAMEFQNVSAYLQSIVTGTILLLLITVDQFVTPEARRKPSRLRAQMLGVIRNRERKLA